MLCVFLSIWMYVHYMHAGAPRDQKRSSRTGVTVSDKMWVLGTKHESSVIVATGAFLSLRHLSIPPANIQLMLAGLNKVER